MAVRSRHLFASDGLSTGVLGDELYEAPAGYYVVVKSLRIVSRSDAPAELYLWAEADGSGVWLFDGTVVPGREVWLDASWHVLPNHAFVLGRSDTADALAITASGAVLGDGTGGGS